jgi:hypothetical protein
MSVGLTGKIDVGSVVSRENVPYLSLGMKDTLLEKNFRAYITGFSDNVQDIIDNFGYRALQVRI